MRHPCLQHQRPNYAHTQDTATAVATHLGTSRTIDVARIRLPAVRRKLRRPRRQIQAPQAQTTIRLPSTTGEAEDAEETENNVTAYRDRMLAGEYDDPKKVDMETATASTYLGGGGDLSWQAINWSTRRGDRDIGRLDSQAKAQKAASTRAAKSTTSKPKRSSK